MYKKNFISNSAKYKNYLFIDKTYEEYLKKISIILNNIHNVSYPKEYWRIVIGPWLIFSISNIFYILKFYKSKSKNLSKKKYLKPSKTPNDYLDFCNKMFNESNWISCLKSEIFKVNLNSKKTIYLKKNIKENFINNFFQRLSFKQKIILKVQKLLSILSINSDLIYWRSYFTTFNILKHSNKFRVNLEGAIVLDLFSGVGSFLVAGFTLGAAFFEAVFALAAGFFFFLV